MYTIDYIKTLYAEYEEWDTDPGSMVWPTDRYSFENNLGEDDFQSLVEIEDEDDFVDAIRGHIQDFLAIGTVKAFRVKDPTGKLVCEYDDGFWD
jgi:hypothetical protein